MFWKFVELIVKIIYFRRFQQAKKIGDAAHLIGQGELEQAQHALDKVGRALHQSLLPLFAFTQAKLLLAKNRLAEAEKAFTSCALMDPRSARADMELALLLGQQQKFDEARKWIDRALDKKDPNFSDQATALGQLLDDLISGKRETQFMERARKMANEKVIDDAVLGYPIDEQLLKQWIAADPQSVRQQFEDVALLMGASKVEQGGLWKLGMAIDDTMVILADGTIFEPFSELNRLCCGTRPPPET